MSPPSKHVSHMLKESFLQTLGQVVSDLIVQHDFFNVNLTLPHIFFEKVVFDGGMV